MTWAEEVTAMRERHRPRTLTARQAEAVLAEVAREHGITIGLLVGPCRITRLVAARRAAAMRLAEKGLGIRDIGTVLGRDHTTIGYLIGRYRREAA